MISQRTKREVMIDQLIFDLEILTSSRNEAILLDRHYWNPRLFLLLLCVALVIGVPCQCSIVP